MHNSPSHKVRMLFKWGTKEQATTVTSIISKSLLCSSKRVMLRKIICGHVLLWNDEPVFCLPKRIAADWRKSILAQWKRQGWSPSLFQRRYACHGVAMETRRRKAWRLLQTSLSNLWGAIFWRTAFVSVC